MSRTLNRSIARHQYARFSKLWRDDLRLAGLYGRAGSPRRPTFDQWYAMHMNDASQMKQSTPKDVVEFLQPDVDPWMEVQQHESPSAKEERGVVTMNIAGGDGDD